MMAWMEMDHNINVWLWKRDSVNVFQMLKFGSEIFEILKKYSCNTKFLQEIAFCRLFRVYQVFIP